jgi:COMPASS component SWD3
LVDSDRFFDNPQLKRQAEEKIKDINEAYQLLKQYQPNSADSTSYRRSCSANVSSKTARAEMFYNQGAENVKAGKYKEALEDFGMVIRLNSTR